MKGTLAILIGVAISGFAAAGSAKNFSQLEAFGPAQARLELEDLQQDASTLFDTVDIDQSGSISVDEYAAQTVVRASLARFTGAVVIDGIETFHVPVPPEAMTQLSHVEQTAIDAIARNEFYRLSGHDGQINLAEWLELSESGFSDADFNVDGQLSGRELHYFALRIARHQTVMS